jgi:hypothetical protein
MRSVLFNFNFELMLLFTEYFKAIPLKSATLQVYGILTVVRACPETQLDYSKSPLTTHEGMWRIYSNPDPHGVKF